MVPEEHTGPDPFRSGDGTYHEFHFEGGDGDDIFGDLFGNMFGGKGRSGSGKSAGHDGFGGSLWFPSGASGFGGSGFHGFVAAEMDFPVLDFLTAATT